MLHPTSFGICLVTQYKVLGRSQRWVIEYMKAFNRCVWADKPACGRSPQAVEGILVKENAVTNSRGRRALRAANYQTCVESRSVT